MKPTSYLETTIPSYYTLAFFDVYVPPVVLEEACQGDPEPVRRRLEVLASFPVLEATPAIERLASMYMAQPALPGKALRDAAHLAFACGYELDYLLTWNCAHIANAEIRRRLMAINAASGRQTPIICTPEELMGTEDTNHV
jgi:hypothetical protein